MQGQWPVSLQGAAMEMGGPDMADIEGGGNLGEGGLLLGGLCIAVAVALAVFVVFDYVRDFNKTDVEREKEAEKSRRGVVQAKSFRIWAILGVVLCCFVIKHVHHISTRPALTSFEANRMVTAPIHENPTLQALTANGQHTEEEARQKIHEHIQANPHLLEERPIHQAKEEHLLVGGIAAAMVMFLAAYLLIDFIREMNRQTYRKQSEQDRRSALRCWALLGIVVCLVVVKHLHHASENINDPIYDDMHTKHYDKEAVTDPFKERGEWIEEHGVLRVKAVKDSVTGDVRTCAYEKERCLCDGHVRYGDGDQWTEWRVRRANFNNQARRSCRLT